MSEIKYYIGYSKDKEIRYKASSGGIGSHIIKYLLSTDEYGSCVNFRFNTETCSYEPVIIYSYEDFNNCGSIYQDIDTFGFIKKNVDIIRSGIIVTCMPCQVQPIRNFLNRNNIKSFIISFCCSGQTTVEGTWCYYKFLGIKKSNVVNIQYRGNGWPSGIQILLKNGELVKRANYTYPWNIIHASLLFRPQRCHNCTFKTVKTADVNLADPWLEEYKADIIGHSIIMANTNDGIQTIEKMCGERLIECINIEEKTYIRSQRGTIEEKARVKDFVPFNKLIKKISSSIIYIKIVTINPALLSLHNRIIRKIKRYYDSKNSK